MRIAVTYENGQIFRHFGRTEQFRLYGGNTCSADEAVMAYLARALVRNENPTCGDHGCGKH